MKFRSCPDCHGQGSLTVLTPCPGCDGEGSITERQIVGLLGDLVSPETLDKIAAMVAESEASNER